jgi:hypothetical protein
VISRHSTHDQAAVDVQVIFFVPVQQKCITNQCLHGYLTLLHSIKTSIYFVLPFLPAPVSSSASAEARPICVNC